MDVVVVETVRGRDSKRYPVGLPRPRAELNRLRHLAHNLHCRDGQPIRQVQATMLASYGIRRSRGAIGNDLKRYECPLCASQPADPAPEPRQQPPLAVHGHPGFLTGMLREDE